MTAGVEGLTISDWLNDTLTADATLMGYLANDDARLGEGLVGAGPDWPIVTWTVGEAIQTNGVGLAELVTLVPFSIKAVTLGQSYAPLVPVVTRIHALIASKVNQAASMGLVLTCERVGGIQYPEQNSGTEYRHLGGLYQAQAQ